MKKLYILIIIISLLLISSVSAIKFSKNTIFTEGNINYIFTEGIEIYNFDITSGGIRIDGDEKLGISIEGGELTITFYQFDDNIKEIGIKSSVPQIINFQITSDSDYQYLFDGNSYYLNTYNIGAEEVIFTYVNFETNEPDNIQTKTIEKLSFFEKRLVQFEISSTIDDNGIIHNKTFNITYLGITIIILVLLLIIFIFTRK